MRLFVAIDVGLAEPSGDRSSAPEHVTLRFLGEVAPERLPDLEAKLADVARALPPFDLVLAGIGAFPNERNPRVVWIGVTEGRAEVSALAAHLATALDEGPGPARAEAFVPHLTLFRVRSPAQRRRAASLLAGTDAPPASRRVRVRAIHLKESRLAPGGARHRTLASWPLTGLPAAAP